jgi:hypothetical protein
VRCKAAPPAPVWPTRSAGGTLRHEKSGFQFALLDERAQFHNDWEWYKQAALRALTRYMDSPSYLRILAEWKGIEFRVPETSAPRIQR